MDASNDEQTQLLRNIWSQLVATDRNLSGRIDGLSGRIDVLAERVDLHLGIHLPD